MLAEIPLCIVCQAAREGPGLQLLENCIHYKLPQAPGLLASHAPLRSVVELLCFVSCCVEGRQAIYCQAAPT